jgi:hypothetical protein
MQIDELIPFNDDTVRKHLGYSAQHWRRLVHDGKVPPLPRIHPDGRPYLTETYIRTVRAAREQS